MSNIHNPGSASPFETNVIAGETHADLTASELAAIHATVGRISDLNDQTAAEQQNLAAQVQAAKERVAQHGGTAATAQALDEAEALVVTLGQHGAQLGDAATATGDQTAAAEAGLAPARDAQDQLASAGARGDYVATATSD
jgi:hypothetical protein